MAIYVNFRLIFCGGEAKLPSSFKRAIGPRTKSGATLLRGRGDGLEQLSPARRLRKVGIDQVCIWLLALRMPHFAEMRRKRAGFAIGKKVFKRFFDSTKRELVPRDFFLAE